MKLTRKTALIALLMFAFALSAKAQEFITLYGHVVDASTSEQLFYSSVA